MPDHCLFALVVAVLAASSAQATQFATTAVDGAPGLMHALDRHVRGIGADPDTGGHQRAVAQAAGDNGQAVGEWFDADDDARAHIGDDRLTSQLTIPKVVWRSLSRMRRVVRWDYYRPSSRPAGGDDDGSVTAEMSPFDLRTRRASGWLLHEANSGALWAAIRMAGSSPWSHAGSPEREAEAAASPVFFPGSRAGASPSGVAGVASGLAGSPGGAGHAAAAPASSPAAAGAPGRSIVGGAKAEPSPTPSIGGVPRAVAAAGTPGAWAGPGGVVAPVFAAAGPREAGPTDAGVPDPGPVGTAPPVLAAPVFAPPVLAPPVFAPPPVAIAVAEPGALVLFATALAALGIVHRHAPLRAGARRA